MRPNVKHAGKIISVVLILVFFSFSCSSPGNKSPQKKPAPEKRKPASLKEIEGQLETLVMTLQKEEEEKIKPKVAAQKPEQKKQGEQGGQEGQQQQQGQQQKGQQQQQKGQQQQQQQEQQQKEEQKKWDKLDKQIENIHRLLNSYQPNAIKDGVDPKTVEGFSNALNSLTNNLDTMDSFNVMVAGNEAYKYLADFDKVYDEKVPPEVKTLKYYTRKTLFDAYKEKWQETNLDIQSLKSAWNVLKPKVKKDDMDKINKMEFAIDEFSKSLNEKNKNLVKIKGNIVLANIESLEKSFSK